MGYEQPLCEKCGNGLEFWKVEEGQVLCGPCDLFDLLGINRIQ
ncbi:hypothetical protein [Nonomuraea rosea]